MSDKLERDIRELFEELDRAAPGPPPMPRRPAPSPRNRGRMLVPAGTAAAVLLVIGVASQFLLGEAGEADDASATTAVAAETTTAAPAATTAADSEALGNLNQACTAFIDESSQAAPDPPTTEEEHLAALQSLVLVYGALSEAVGIADAAMRDPAFNPIADEAADLFGLVERGATGPLHQAEAAYQSAVQETAELGEKLSDYGATDCAGLGSQLYP